MWRNLAISSEQNASDIPGTWRWVLIYEKRTQLIRNGKMLPQRARTSPSRPSQIISFSLPH
jgi:hypothetical protein